MSAYQSLSKAKLMAKRSQLEQYIQILKAKNLNLDMTRGKPSPEQLALSMPILNSVTEEHVITANDVDIRNYGGLDGLIEAKKLFCEYMEVKASQIIIGGNSSLTMMHDAMSIAMLHGTTEGGAWIKQGPLKFICPVPGYDRHFSISQHLGFELIPVELTLSGPQMDQVEALVKDDALIKGIWCVPKYSNPTGICYSDEVVERLAKMHTAAEDFRIFWDNAYAFHHLGEGAAQLKNILTACESAGYPQRPYLFGSTSKMTFPSAGVAMMAGSEKNMAFFFSHLAYQTIGPDKINQLRHVNFFKNKAGILAHMDKHAELLKPRFNTVSSVMTNCLAGKGIASWHEPKGGYFISLDVLPGCAKKVIAMAQQLGVKLTPAGSPFPYMRDTEDKNIRIAPSFPSIEEVRAGTEVVCVCVKKIALDKLLASQD